MEKKKLASKKKAQIGILIIFLVHFFLLRVYYYWVLNKHERVIQQVTSSTITLFISQGQHWECDDKTKKKAEATFNNQ